MTKTTPRETTLAVKVSVETWIVIALLHKEQPQREDFAISEIVQKAEEERIVGGLRPGLRVHATLHCVANRAPNPGRYRMLYATGKHTRRLFRPGDDFHPSRADTPCLPREDEVPAQYRKLLEWYEKDYLKRAPQAPGVDPLLALRGSGRRLWADEQPDDYVRRLREAWE
jgi:hypothetical protein